jgi:ketosteroid isomerase-like protein
MTASFHGVGPSSLIAEQFGRTMSHSSVDHPQVCMTPTRREPAFDAAEILAALDSLVVTLQDPSPMERTSAYTDDATFVMPGVSTIHGRAELLCHLETEAVLSSVTVTPHQVEGSGDLAYASGMFTYMADATTPGAMRFLMVWHKEADGVWRIAREFLSTEPPVSSHGPGVNGSGQAQPDGELEQLAAEHRGRAPILAAEQTRRKRNARNALEHVINTRLAVTAQDQAVGDRDDALLRTDERATFRPPSSGGL